MPKITGEPIEVKQFIIDTQEMLHTLLSDHKRIKRFNDLISDIDHIDFSDSSEDMINNVLDTFEIIIEMFPNIIGYLEKYYCNDHTPSQCNYCHVYSYIDRYTDQ